MSESESRMVTVPTVDHSDVTTAEPDWCLGHVDARPDVSERHLGFDTFDLVGQTLVSHHFTRDGDAGRYRRGTCRQRYAWPAELDLMARIAGHERGEVPQWAQAVKMPPPRAVCAGRGHDRESYFFLPWFFTASMAAFAASGSRYVPPGFSGLKSASSS